MKADDLRVQKALQEAGFGAWPTGSRGELFDTLAQIRKGNSVAIEDFVDQQRQILEAATNLEEAQELEILRDRHSFVKACPECRHRPDFGLGYTTVNSDPLVVCMNHPAGAVTRAGKSMSEALERWNADDWFLPGPDREFFAL